LFEKKKIIKILFVAELGKFEIKEENQEEPKPKRRKKK